MIINRYFFTIFIICFLLINFDSINAFEELTSLEAEKNVHFMWAFGVIRTDSQVKELETLSGDTALKTGDKIKFFIQLKSQCYLYLLYKDSNGEFSVLFPFSFESSANENPELESFFIPQNKLWFEIDDNIGKEIFYLLASANRLNEIEELIYTYENAGQSEKHEIEEKILAEIKNIKKRNTNLRISAEHPIRILGNKRIIDEVKINSLDRLTQEAIEVRADNLYSRTYTIDHQ